LDRELLPARLKQLVVGGGVVVWWCGGVEECGAYQKSYRCLSAILDLLPVASRSIDMKDRGS
jgi:hypothetical protein